MVQPLIRMVVLCVQVFAAGGFAAAQVALGFVIQQHGAYLLPKAGGQVLQAALVLPHGTFAHAEHWNTNADGTYYFDPITGAMAKGTTTIDGMTYYFDPATGVKR